MCRGSLGQGRGSLGLAAAYAAGTASAFLQRYHADSCKGGICGEGLFFGALFFFLAPFFFFGALLF